MNEIIALAEPNDTYCGHKEFYLNAHNAIMQFHEVRNYPQLPEIWVRDFFPLQNRNTKQLYIPFYNPPYQSKKLNEKIRNSVAGYFPYAKDLPVRIDGGNLIINNNGVAFAFKRSTIFKNTSQNQVEKLLKDSLDISDLVWIPNEIGDKFGHIDGFMQFLDNNILLINDNSYDAYLKKHLERCIDIILKTHPELKIIKIPVNVSDNTMSAKGIYTNFLETSKIVFIPQYNLPEDKKVAAIIQSLTNKSIIGIDCEKISKYGGSLHCLTNSYRSIS
jgi:agmatine/peptidylarginine deiminase